MRRTTYWLSYGGGVNSTALAVLLATGKLPQYMPCRFLWSDVQDEKEETYAYIFQTFMPWLRERGHTLEVVRPQEGVLERCERLEVVNQRMIRRCTAEAKVKPIMAHLCAHAQPGDIQLIGIDAGEPHRAKPAYPSDPFEKRFPLIELGLDRDGCERVIADAGLPVPPKSGCWHCPFARVSEILELARTDPCKVERIARLEERSNEVHPVEPGQPPRSNWGRKTAREWLERARGGPMFAERMEDDEDLPCQCYDG